MTAPARPRRSVLYMPGSKSRALEKAQTLPADALILDLEDAVAPSEKEIARALVCDAVRAGGFGQREVVIRINGLDTPWGMDDLTAACAAHPDAILIPKVNSAADLKRPAEQAPEGTALWAMMETPRGILNAAEIAAAPRLACFILGTNDLVNDLHAAHTPDRMPILTALSWCLLAARAEGIACIDGVYNAFKDEDGLRAACLQGRDMGFDGKTLIHPAQLAIANEVFAPSETDLEQARAYVAAFEAAEAAGEGVAVVNGKIVENLHVANARRLLAQAEAIAALEAEAA
ncbi:citrate lyase beta subunit [Rubricella aquisinus]|uniref:Citrate lyase beta subunit n=1 Tax=Rubricella aquisinus TaxID=2028108 RepID=A0A840X0Y3_9RHOB|nr:CoA ester lyase [Rubricella aquisinus]MBB5517040.1 citrate lyase beta subunit [Rubricella aquisinus]